MTHETLATHLETLLQERQAKKQELDVLVAQLNALNGKIAFCQALLQEFTTLPAAASGGAGVEQ